MADRNEIELDKQYLADLEKAKALSLETHELEKIRQQRFSQPDPQPRTLEEYKIYLQRKTQLHQYAATAARNDSTSSNTVVPVSTRRSSDIRPPAALQETHRGRDEADLISFNAPPPPPNPQDEAHNSLKELVNQMHSLNSQRSLEQAYKTQRSFSMSSASYGGYSPAYLQQKVVQTSNPSTMQLVPYNQQQAKPRPLTPDELTRLYSMRPYGGAASAAAMPNAAYVSQAHYPVNYT